MSGPARPGGKTFNYKQPGECELEKFFDLKGHGTTVRTEIFAGLTTFFAMAYIVFVNPAQVAGGGATGWLAGAGADAGALGQIWNAVYIASLLSAVVGTLLMALYARMPFAQACGMGLNAFFCTCFVAGAHFAGVDVITGYHSGLVIILLSGVVFLVLSITGAREYIARALPDCMKKAIPAGIGLFIAFIGFQNAGIIQANQYTLLQFVDIHGGDWATVAPALTALIGFIIIGVLAKLRVKGNVILGILASTVVYYLFMGTVPAFDVSHVGQAFADFGRVSLFGLFRGDAWRQAFAGAHVGGAFNALLLIVSFCLVDMFDTVGTLYGTAAQAGMLDEKGDPINMNRSMMSDSIATVAGALLGTSTTTTFVESASGVAEGGRTGLTSLTTAVCFALCLFLSPLASIIPPAATAPALIYVGVLMLGSFSQVDMKDPSSAVPAFLALIMMPMTYSISNGIGISAIAYTLMQLLTGRLTKKDAVVAGIGLLFVLKFAFITM